jgi:hypothetical protein
MAKADEWLRPAMQVLIIVPALGPIRTGIAWQMAGRFGGSFQVPLTAAQLFAAGMTGLEQGRA